jgi:DnaK suppressor protein
MVTPLSSSDLELLAAALRTRRAATGGAVHDRLHRHGLTTHEDAALPNRREDTDDDAAADTATRMDIAAVARAAEEIESLDGALRRIADGEYGLCVECGEEIARERLFANPAATRCAECQQLAERTARIVRLTRA